jgi:hypothetical protein
MDRDRRDLSDLYRAFAAHTPRHYTPTEERLIAEAARRLEDEAVARLYLDIARWEKGERA